MDHQTPLPRRQGPLRRSKARLRRPPPQPPPHIRQSTRSPIPTRGLQPVPLEPLLELTFRWETETARPLQSDGPFLIFSSLRTLRLCDLCVKFLVLLPRRIRIKPHRYLNTLFFF